MSVELKRLELEKLCADENNRFLLYGPWVIKVPDSFSHPGGNHVLDNVKPPKDCSMYFDTTRQGRGHTVKARNLMKSFIIGYLTKEKPNGDLGTLSVKPQTFYDILKKSLAIIVFIGAHLVLFLYITGQD